MQGKGIIHSELSTFLCTQFTTTMESYQPVEHEAQPREESDVKEPVLSNIHAFCDQLHEIREELVWHTQTYSAYKKNAVRQTVNFRDVHIFKDKLTNKPV